MHVHAPEKRVNRCCISLHKKQQAQKQCRLSPLWQPSNRTHKHSVYRENCQNESNKKWRMCLFSALKTLTILLRRCYKHHTLWPPLHLLISSLYLQLNTMKASLCSPASLSHTITHISREQYYMAGFLLVACRGCNDSNFSLNQQISQHLTWNIR